MASCLLGWLLVFGGRWLRRCSGAGLFALLPGQAQGLGAAVGRDQTDAQEHRAAFDLGKLIGIDLGQGGAKAGNAATGDIMKAAQRVHPQGAED